jgi:large-conductance mechanosensitive channel
MNKTVKSALRYVIEIVIVAFGVFLGVYYSNLNAAEKTDKEKEKSISLIIQELENNQRLLLKDIDYHE